MKKILTLGMLAVISLMGCYYDVEENLYPDTGCDTENMSFAADIQPILQQNCLVCHSQAANFGNVNLEGHNRVKLYADSGELLGVIEHQSGFSPMPKNAPKLVDCQIEKIARWISDGALNN